MPLATSTGTITSAGGYLYEFVRMPYLLWWLTKYAHFIGVNHTFTAKKIAEVYVENVALLHGIPHTIISDRGALFTSNFW